MTSLNNAYLSGVDAALIKYASKGRAMARQWGQQFQQTKDPRFLQLAAQAGEASFSPTSRPTAVAKLPSGGETLNNQLMIAPQNGRATAQVWKEYNTKSPSFSPEMLKRREAIGLANQNNPAMAKFYGAGTSPAGNPVHRAEFIPGTEVNPDRVRRNPQLQQQVFEAQKGVMRASGKAGFPAVRDLREANMIMDSRTGKPRVVDYMPFKRNEAYPSYAHGAAGAGRQGMVMQPAGERLFPSRVEGELLNTPEAHAKFKAMAQARRMQQLGLGQPAAPVPPPVRRAPPPGNEGATRVDKIPARR